jgi:hypothetical protein
MNRKIVQEIADAAFNLAQDYRQGRGEIPAVGECVLDGQPHCAFGYVIKKADLIWRLPIHDPDTGEMNKPSVAENDAAFAQLANLTIMGVPDDVFHVLDDLSEANDGSDEEDRRKACVMYLERLHDVLYKIIDPPPVNALH